MAKYIGTLTSDMRGKVGGVVFSKARTGTTIKANRGPINPATSYQQATRAAVASAQAEWRGLSGAERTSWGVLAAQYTYLNSLAQAYSPTGQQLWTGTYVNAHKCNGVPPPMAPGSKPVISPITSMNFTFADAEMIITLNSGGSVYDGPSTLAASAGLSPGVNYSRSIGLRPMGFDTTGNEYFFQNTYLAVWGAFPAAGAGVCFRAVPWDLASFITGTPLVVILPAIP
jgi:hypothetical protein